MVCSVLGGRFAILMQVILFTVTCSVLVWKKYMENSERTWFEFGLDSSKQIAGAGWIHIANMLCAILFAGKLVGVDGCTWYAANIIIDTTLGVFVEWSLLKGITLAIQKMSCEALAQLMESGSYRDEHGHFRPSAYMLQMAVWLFIVTCMKVSMVALMQSAPFLVYSVNFVLTWFNDNAREKLFVVMICVPLMMNTFQFVLTDNFIKKRRPVLYHADSREIRDSEHTLKAELLHPPPSV
mmetsp:Transcript_73032/g.152509  ORF Transcript_73032/g.152509 Transcript_73032/m.152509 type:complete len:239 (-) Transcript_73032:15-731(-)